MNFKRLSQRMTHREDYQKPIIGELIRRKRHEDKITQEVLARGLCSVSYLSKVENNKIEPTAYFIEEMSERIGQDLVQAYHLGEDPLVCDIIKHYFYQDLKSLVEIEKRVAHLHNQLLSDVLELAVILLKDNTLTVLKEKVETLECLVPHMGESLKLLYLVLAGEVYVKSQAYSDAVKTFLIFQHMQYKNPYVDCLKALRLTEAYVHTTSFIKAMEHYTLAKRLCVELFYTEGLTMLEFFKAIARTLLFPTHEEKDIVSFGAKTCVNTEPLKTYAQAFKTLGHKKSATQVLDVDLANIQFTRYSAKTLAIKTLLNYTLSEAEYLYVENLDACFAPEKTIVMLKKDTNTITSKQVKEILVPLCLEYERFDLLNYFQDLVLKDLEVRSRYKEMIAFERKVAKVMKKVQVINL